MVTENTPKYIIDLEKSMNRQFSEVKDEIRETRTLVDNLAIVMKKEFDVVKADISEIREDVEQLQFDVKKLEISVEKIEGHIGRYEIRAQNIELIILEDHKPRIKELERIILK